MLHVVIATNNRHKFLELTALLRVRGIRWHSLAEFPSLPGVREDGKTFAANAVKKARAVARATGWFALADDSGIEVQALGWGPGVQSARFAGRHGDDQANNAKLLRALNHLPIARRRARYRCVLALANPRRLLAAVTGTWDGRIAFAPEGSGGFGYDPLFLVPGFGQTVGRLPASVKRRLSHRARATRRMKPVLQRLARASGRTGSGAGRAGRARAVSARPAG
ncbi:MAG: non-canonical purine NTP pyrophosphatase [Candidatus Omnitrophica bacterium]|nr:non-canonical purine NTP pyrophosphatase [Candidatus Omnitrophota bacterium]